MGGRRPPNSSSCHKTNIRDFEAHKPGTSGQEYEILICVNYSKPTDFLVVQAPLQSRVAVAASSGTVLRCSGYLYA
jgi:hypothetical protein